MEFVVFDATGKEIDWIDPYISHEEVRPGVVRVENTFAFYSVHLPDGGRYEIRQMQEGQA